MKKMGLFFLVLMLWCIPLFGCSQSSGLEYPLSGIEAGSGSLFWETEEGYYTVYTMYSPDLLAEPISAPESLEAFGTDGTAGIQTGAYLYRSGKEEINWQPVCPNESCPHTGLYCGARLGNTTVSFGIDNGHIYFTSYDFVENGEVGLFQMDMDGGNRKLVTALPCEDGWVYGGLYHKGDYFYYQYQVTEDGSLMSERIYRYKLEGKQEPELILEESMAEDLAGYRIYPVGDQVYFMRKNREGGADMLSYDLKQKKLETKWEDCLSSHIWPDEEGCFFIKKGEGVFFLDWEEGKTSQIIASGDEDGTWYFDGTYFYEALAAWKQAGKEDRFRIYTPQGNLVQEIAYPIRAEFAQVGILIEDQEVRRQNLLPGNYENLYYWGSTENFILFSREVSSEMPNWYLEKDKIGTEQLAWKAGTPQIDRPQDFNREMLVEVLEDLKEKGLGVPIS